MASPSSFQVSLLGPPEIHHQPPSPTAAATTKKDPFMDLMVQKFNNTVLPPIGFTENGSPTFLSTGNPCLDFFFHVVPDTPPQTLTQRLEIAWNHDPLKTLKLLCNLRGVRGTGKSDKEGGYTAALWLHKNHPKTLACNVASFAEFGYYKDLLEILFRLLEGSDARKLAKDAYQQWKQRKEMWDSAKEARKQRKQMVEMRKQQGKKTARGHRFNRPVYRGSIHRGRSGGHVYRGSLYRGRSGRHGYRGRSSAYNGGNRFSELMKETEPKLSREEKRLQRAKNVLERFNRDPDFKFLHERVSDYFAECLRSDVKLLSLGKLNKISLAAKWCPSLDSSYDVITLLCESIGRKVFPRDEYPEYQGVEEAHYAYRVRDRLRKEVLVPLRKALELPEVYMGANDWGSIPYNRVASVAMQTYKEKFHKHDEERFSDYLEKVRKGEAKIAAGALLPHRIIASLDDDDGGEVAELQWKRMVGDMAKKGTLNNCLAISDVSGSMSGIPMEVSVALGVLVSELSEEPWKGKLITFSENPKLQMVQGSSLKEKTEFVREMDWGANTDFQKVFDLILEVAVNGKLKPEEMIKRLFVFSDMEFDQANARSHFNPYHIRSYSGSSESDSDYEAPEGGKGWETDYEVIVRKFTEHGYGDYVPEIVFWNLRNSSATPVPAKQPGVALVSGFSKNLMTLFLEEGKILSPQAVMDDAISGKEYQKLAVLD